MTKGLKNDRAKAMIIPPVITPAPCPWGRALVLQLKDDMINQKSQGYFKHSVENWIPDQVGNDTSGLDSRSGRYVTTAVVSISL